PKAVRSAAVPAKNHPRKDSALRPRLSSRAYSSTEAGTTSIGKVDPEHVKERNQKVSRLDFRYPDVLPDVQGKFEHLACGCGYRSDSLNISRDDFNIESPAATEGRGEQ